MGKNDCVRIVRDIRDRHFPLRMNVNETFLRPHPAISDRRYKRDSFIIEKL